MTKLHSTTRIEVLNAISDDISLKLFDAVAEEGIEKDQMGGLNLTRKQYYTRIAKLVNAGLIRRQHRIYTLTAFGKVIYGVKVTLSKAMDNRWKFRAIDAMKEKNKLSAEEYQKATDLLFDDAKLKQVIFR